MEDYIKLSTLNDFAFCPKSIYYHNLYDNYAKRLYQQEAQIAGTLAHESIDMGTYSTRKDVLQGMSVYSETYRIAGKIDLYYAKEGKLVERKKFAPKIYRGQRYQIWGQMYCLEEMGYEVQSMWLYSLDDNKMHRIYKPSTDDKIKFEKMLDDYRHFDVMKPGWTQNSEKCLKCIYRELCDYFMGEVYPQMSLFEE